MTEITRDSPPYRIRQTGNRQFRLQHLFPVFIEMRVHGYEYVDAADHPPFASLDAARNKCREIIDAQIWADKDSETLGVYNI